MHSGILVEHRPMAANRRSSTSLPPVSPIGMSSVGPHLYCLGPDQPCPLFPSGSSVHVVGKLIVPSLTSHVLCPPQAGPVNTVGKLLSRPRGPGGRIHGWPHTHMDATADATRGRREPRAGDVAPLTLPDFVSGGLKWSGPSTEHDGGPSAVPASERQPPSVVQECYSSEVADAPA